MKKGIYDFYKSLGLEDPRVFAMNKTEENMLNPENHSLADYGEIGTGRTTRLLVQALYLAAYSDIDVEIIFPEIKYCHVFRAELERLFQCLLHVDHKIGTRETLNDRTGALLVDNGAAGTTCAISCNTFDQRHHRSSGKIQTSVLFFDHTINGYGLGNLGWYE